MSKLAISFFCFTALVFSIGLTAADPVKNPAVEASSLNLHNLSQADIKALKSGEILLRPLKNQRQLALKATGAAADELRSAITKLNPNYLSELIVLLPLSTLNSEATETETSLSLKALAWLKAFALQLADVEGYVGIPYYSKRQETYYDLFDSMQVVRRTAFTDDLTKRSGQTIETVQHMEPFDSYRANYHYIIDQTAGAASLFFRASNLDALVYYGGVRAVAAGDMLWLLYIYQVDDQLVYYGLGAFKAFDFFGLIRDRLETSLLGRVEAFFGFMQAKFRDN